MQNLPSLPHSWSSLTWKQLCSCWSVKMRYGGNPDVARASALLMLCGLEMEQGTVTLPDAGETVYFLRGRDGRRWKATPREVACLAREALPWFDFPYGDPGSDPVKDDKGRVVKEGRKAVSGYVCPEWKDAMLLPKDELKVARRRFALPQVAMNNITWQQYRSLQSIAPQLFLEGIAGEQVLLLQAQFLAHCLVPRSLSLLDTTGGSIRFRPHWGYVYDAGRAEQLTGFWMRRLDESFRKGAGEETSAVILFHVCFQMYQTSLAYYAKSYPMLFSGPGRHDPLKDALTGEVGTINTVMKYAGYAEQQQVYDSNLPFVLDILNTMSKEAAEIEKMNSKMKKK